MKRAVDIAIATLLSILLFIPALLVALVIMLDSHGPLLTRPHRVGRSGRMVKVWEFRTANADPDAMETVGGCHGEQVTRVGAALRKTGIARWPMLWSVLRGDFAIVGPRAEMPRYVGVYPPDLRKVVLSVKPGLVDLSTRELRAERALLAGLEGDALEEAYVEKVLPRRLELGKRYVEGRGFWMDLRILAGWIAGPLLR
ncbi:MAG: hypothetical protein RL404_290 [Pseudomonadota bacterium]|jgi:lipopolysaccharide/colanic/teichoic acid biosynthesis glycosyltransferase